MIDEVEDITEKQKKQWEQLKSDEIRNNQSKIAEFRKFCGTLGIDVSTDCIDYVQAIGVVAQSPSLLESIFKDVKKDKDGLYSWSELIRLIRNKDFMPGYIPTDNFVAMVHPYFRRGMHSVNNFTPRFVDLFWEVDAPKIDAYIALDPDCV